MSRHGLPQPCGGLARVTSRDRQCCSLAVLLRCPCTSPFSERSRSRPTTDGPSPSPPRNGGPSSRRCSSRRVDRSRSNTSRNCSGATAHHQRPGSRSRRMSHDSDTRDRSRSHRDGPRRLRPAPGRRRARRHRIRTARRGRPPLDGDASLGGSVDRIGLSISVWRGPAYASIADSPTVQAETARLDEVYLRSSRAGSKRILALGRHAAVCGELDALVTRHPLRENLWRLLMLALYRSGRQVDALGAYRRLRTTLVEDIGVDPSPALRT